MYALKKLCHKVDAPLLIAGDVFDRWDESGAWGLNTLIPAFKGLNVITIPGQHDLPYHNTSLAAMSPYNVLHHLDNFTSHHHEDCHLYSNSLMLVDGIGWDDSFGTVGAVPNGYLSKRADGFREWIEADKKRRSRQEVGKINIVMLHAYCAVPNMQNKHRLVETPPGIEQTCHYANYIEMFNEVDFLVFGDNHTPYHFCPEEDTLPTIVNCGGVFNRTLADKGATRYAYILYDDKTVKPVALNDPSKEEWVEGNLFFDEIGVCDKTTQKNMKIIAKYLEDRESGVQSSIEVLLTELNKTMRKHDEMTKKMVKDLIDSARRKDDHAGHL